MAKKSKEPALTIVVAELFGLLGDITGLFLRGFFMGLGFWWAFMLLFK